MRKLSNSANWAGGNGQFALRASWGCLTDGYEDDETDLGKVLEKILKYSPFLLAYCSRDLRYLCASKAYAAMLGRTENEIIGRRIVDIIGPQAFEPIRPYIDAVLLGQRVEYERVVNYSKAGPRRIHVIYVPELDKEQRVIGWVSSAVDITEQADAEAKRHESENRFYVLANSAPVLLWMSGRDSLCSFFNAGWLQFTGRSMEQEIGDGWAQGVHPDDLQRCLEIYRSAFDARQSFEMEYRLRRYDGEYRWIVDKGEPRYDSNGEFMGYVGSAIDISQRKQGEDDLRELAHLQRLASAGELAASIAHELRQPLAAIMSNTDAARMLLNSSKVPLQELREIVTDIAMANKRAGEIVTRIREFMNKKQTRGQTLDCNSTVSMALKFITGDALRRRIKLQADLAHGLPPVVGDPVQLQQVVINLAVNGMDAMDRTPEAERCLTIQTKPDERGYVEVAVIDRGSGFDPGDLPRLFDSFVTTKANGTGLGLSISRSIVHSHGGRIWAEVNPRGGAAFRFTVPTQTGTAN